MVDFNKLKWDTRFMNMAQLVSKWSKDPSTQVGAVVADERHRIVSVGYNGFPRGMKDDSELYENREIKYDRVIHAEVNALMNAKTSVEGCTIYLFPLFSCPRCAVQLIQAGIKRIVYLNHDCDSPFNEKQITWKCGVAMDMCKEVGIELRHISSRVWKDDL